VKDFLRGVGWLAGIIGLGAVPIGGGAFGLYLLYRAAGSGERFAKWVLLYGVVGGFILALLLFACFALGAKIWYRDFDNLEKPRIEPWLQERRALRDAKAKALEAAKAQDGQLSEAGDTGRLSYAEVQK
jgi:hypothetical protein